MKKLLLRAALSALFLLLCVGCSRQQPRYVIGVSQCSEDIWRDKQNAELRMGTYFRDDVELRFAAAYDSDERQVQQIDSLISEGIDLLIVAPNQVQTISPAIDRAYDCGIPVIVFERKTNSKKYTAFISADNYEMGCQMGDYIAKKLGGHGRVLEVMGLKGSSPAQERHKGFADAIQAYPGIQLVANLQGDWTEQSGYQAVKQWLSTDTHHLSPNTPIDFVFGQNDRMAMGARRALNEELRMKNEEFAAAIPPADGTSVGNSSLFTFHFSLPRFCGIDGLPGEGGGIQLVRDSVLDASYIYPTHGDQLLDVAISILDGQPFEKEILLQSALVTRDNANVLLMQNEEIVRQTNYLDQLHEKAAGYLQELDTQRLLTLLLAVIVVLITVSAVFVVTAERRRHRLERQAFSMVTQWSGEVKTEITGAEVRGAEVRGDEVRGDEVRGDENSLSAESNLEPPSLEPRTSEKSDITAVTPEERAAIEAEADADARFLERLRQCVQEQMGDSDFGVEMLAAQMGVSRVQLYRKVKTMTGRTPVDIIRQSRLNRSRVLLAQEGTTVSEVAYAVGFSSPSYFTKCFKEEYGMLPTKLNN